MPEYVTALGLAIPSIEDILTALTQDQRAGIDAGLNTNPDSPIGQLNGIFADRERNIWEVLAIAYNGNNPDACEGFLLEAIAAVTGTKRAAATRSRFIGTRKITVNLNGGTTLPALTTKFNVAGNPSIVFRTKTEITADAGTGNYQVEAECVETGPIACNAGTLTVIATPIVGLNSVTNDFDAELGSLADNDTQLRLRRESELRATGSGTVDSIRADVLSISLDDGSKPIIECIVLENTTDTIDVNGLPPHSLECLVFDGISNDCPNDTLAQTIWKSKPAGIRVIGSSSGTAIDSRGNSRIIPFSRPTNKEVILKATLVLVNPSQLPSQYLAAVQEAVLAAFASKVKTGSVIRCNHYEAAILAISGIEDATVQLAFAPGPHLSAGVNLSLGIREIGYIQSSGITVA